VAPRSVIDLLAEQPEEALLAMREAVQKELARLTVEAQQIDQAIAKNSRRNRGGSDRLTREQVFEVVKQAGGPASPAAVHKILAAQGVDASLNSVRNHLTRLVDKNGWLIRMGDGTFIPAPKPPADDDIPF
jgi:hypothetical protein